MNIKNQEQKPNKIPYLNYIVYILCGLSLFLGTYVWIHHQTLSMSEEKIKQHDQLLPKLEETKKELETKINDFIQTEYQKHESALLENVFKNHSDQESENQFQPSDPTKFLSFDKLIGFKEELKAVQGFIDYLKNPDNYQGVGDVEVPLGILMYGCPGTGKTTLARALAKETNLPFFEVESSTFFQKFIGIGPQKVKDLFSQVRLVAKKNNGAIIFLDECENIFTDLSRVESGSEITNIVNQFKTEMTSMKNDPTKPIFIIGATNNHHVIDEAIKSRFTYNIEIKPGNKAERKQMLEFLIKKRKNPYSAEAKHYLFEVINESLDRLRILTFVFVLLYFLVCFQCCK
ncbi:MAG: AAA family ATPase [Candidatus Phytoplasma stylosanthis]|nr:AAA family ATPase [Candidatus Phytoplasma stylosanthis]